MRWLLPLVLLAGCGPKAFPDTFLFGASIAGFQVDMGCPTLPAAQCEDPNSDWYQFVTSRDQLQDLTDIVAFDPPSTGPGFWELYEQDFDRAKDGLGLGAVRLSIEWSRIFPTATDGLDGDALRWAANADAIATYHAMFAAMKKRGLQPLVTINHYTLPLWMHDGVACHHDLATCTRRGWLDHDRMLSELPKYAGFIAREFGGEVDLWATLNEPLAVVLPGYVLRSGERANPPEAPGHYAEARQVIVTMIEAHAAMYDAVKANDVVDADGNGKASEIGLVFPIAPTRPKDPSNPVDVRGAKNLFYIYNTAFLDGVALGLVDADLDGTPDGDPRPDLVGRMDWVGINAYTRITVEGAGVAVLPDLSPLSTINPLTLQTLEDYPRGIYESEIWVKDRYHLPSIITETGAPPSDDEAASASWLARYVTWTKRAIRDDADVRGFFYWSLIDNYEWNHGINFRVGLYAVGTDQARTRTPRPGVDAYRQITRARDVPEALAKKYPAPE